MIRIFLSSCFCLLFNSIPCRHFVKPDADEFADDVRHFTAAFVRNLLHLLQVVAGKGAENRRSLFSRGCVDSHKMSIDTIDFLV